MICEKCGVDYPIKIYKAHIKRCTVQEAVQDEGEITFINPYGEMSFNQMRAEVKKRGLTASKNPTKAELELILVGDDANA